MTDKPFAVLACVLILGAYAPVEDASAAPPTRPPGPAGKAARSGAGSEPSTYAPDRLIIKFKGRGQQGLALSAHRLLAAAKGEEPVAGALAPYSSLVDLNRQHRLKSIRGLFFDRRNTSSDEADKREKAWLEAIRARYPARSKRAPGTEAPDAGLGHYYVLEFEPGVDLHKALRQYLGDPHVEWAGFDSRVVLRHDPNDPFFHSQGTWGQKEADLWGLKKLDMETSWDLTRGQGIVVAVVDSGIDADHPDITQNLWTNPGEVPGNGIDDDGNGFTDDVHGWDFVNNDNDPTDDNVVGHGTHVAGAIAAVGDNKLGIIGVAPGARVMAVKGVGKGLKVDSSVMIPAFQYAFANGADVINCSWGVDPTEIPQALEHLVRIAHSLGVVVVFAAGNGQDLTDVTPLTNMREPIKVAATFPDDTWARSFSRWGKFVDVAAPGGSPDDSASGTSPNRSILSLRSRSVAQGATTSVGDRYLRLSGTSQAAPFVSGSAALILSRRPEFTNEDVRQVLRTSAQDVDDPGFDFHTGYGRINAARALAIDAPLRVRLLKPIDGTPFSPGSEVLSVVGAVSGTELNNWQLSFSPLSALGSSTPIGKPGHRPAANIRHEWDVRGLKEGAYLLRLSATDNRARIYEDTVRVYRESSAIKSITDDPIFQIGVAVSGNHMVWQNSGDTLANPPEPSRLFAKDFSSGKRTELVLAAGTSARHFVLSGRYAVAAVGQFPMPDSVRTLVLYDLDSGTSRTIRQNKDDSTAFDVLAASANRIVWVESIDTHPKLVSYDIVTGDLKIKQLDTDLGITDIIGDLDLDGDRVALTFTTSVGVYDLALDKVQMITGKGDTAAVDTARISGDVIVWQSSVDDLFPRADILMHNLRTGERRAISRGRELVMGIAISGDRVVWSDARNGNHDIYRSDLAKGTEAPITCRPVEQTSPAISGPRVAWLANNRAKVVGSGVMENDVEAIELTDAP